MYFLNCLCRFYNKFSIFIIRVRMVSVHITFSYISWQLIRITAPFLSPFFDIKHQSTSSLSMTFFGYRFFIKMYSISSFHSSELFSFSLFNLCSLQIEAPYEKCWGTQLKIFCIINNIWLPKIRLYFTL